MLTRHSSAATQLTTLIHRAAISLTLVSPTTHCPSDSELPDCAQTLKSTAYWGQRVHLEVLNCRHGTLKHYTIICLEIPLHRLAGHSQYSLNILHCRSQTHQLIATGSQVESHGQPGRVTRASTCSAEPHKSPSARTTALSCPSLRKPKSPVSVSPTVHWTQHSSMGGAVHNTLQTCTINRQSAHPANGCAFSADCVGVL
jgi:hypothetical protein